MKSALFKLNIFQQDEASSSMKGVYFHPNSWRIPGDLQTHLQTLLNAIHQEKKVRVRYRYIWDRVNESCVDGLGLVAKEFVWVVVWRIGEKSAFFEIGSISDKKVNFEIQDS